MKKTVYILLAAMGLLACTKEVDVRVATPDETSGNGSGVKTYLSVGIEQESNDAAPASGVSSDDPETKTYLGASEGGKRKVYWSNGDKVAVNGTASAALANLADNSEEATFEVEGNLELPYKVVYPASAYKDATHITLPAVQTYKEGDIADGMLPLAGLSAVDGSSLKLNHLCAMVKVSITRSDAAGADEDNIAAVRFQGGNSEKVSGDFEIAYSVSNPVTLSPASGSESDLEVKVEKSLATSTSAAVEYYLVVPARLYDNGFRIIVQDANGHIMTKSLLRSVTLAPGILYNLTSFAYEPNSTIEIKNAEELILFAQRFNNKEFAGMGSSLSVTVTDNISFFDSADPTVAGSYAAFNATGGIGQKANYNGANGDNYFPGVFNGNNKTISGLKATVPLFAYTDTGSTIQDLTVSSTSSLTINPSDIYDVHGVIVGRGKGLVKNCTVNANVVINNIQDVTSKEQHYGGIVGRNYGGTIDGCTMNGDITCSQAGQTITTNNINIGGIAGTQADAGSIEGSYFKGNIIISDGTTYGGITADGLYFYVGGIVGYATDGIISECIAGESGTATSIDLRGTNVPAVGGIAGWLSKDENSKIEKCTNYMSLSVANNGARAVTTPIRIGGIAANTAAAVSYSYNYGPISSVSNSTTAFLGGIAATGSKIDNCVNYASGSITRTNAAAAVGQTNRYMYIGGILGAANAAADIVACTNKASVTSNILGTSTASTLDLGGIVGGCATYQIDIDGCTNEGEVKLDNDNESAAAVARIAIGGILGYATTANTTVTDSENKGKVWCNNNSLGSYGPITIGGVIGRSSASCTVTDCVNAGAVLCQKVGAATKTTVDVGGIVGWAEGQITISGTSSGNTRNSGTVDVAEGNSTETVYARITMGGILGYSSAANSTITNSNNSAQVHCEFQGTGSNRVSYIGGIAGIMANLTYNTDGTPKGFGGQAGFEISFCNNTGAVWSRNLNTSGGNKTGNFTGGIVGALSGAATDKASLHDCTSTTGQTTNYRGFAGGIAGYLSYADLSDNSASQIITGNAKNTRGSGGIVGSAQNESTISNCTFSGTINNVQNIGGLAYILSANSSITGSKVDGVTLTTGTNSATAAAVLVSNAASGATITDCGVKGTLDGAAITLSSNMITTNGGATVTGTYLIP